MGLEEISTRAGAQRPSSPTLSARELQDLHQSRRTGHLVPGTVVLSLNKTLASFLHCAAHVLSRDVGAPVPGVEREELGKLWRTMRHWWRGGERTDGGANGWTDGQKS